MEIREMIKTLTGIDVQTNYLDTLQAHPENFTSNQRETNMLKDLFVLLQLPAKKEATTYDII